MMRWIMVGSLLFLASSCFVTRSEGDQMLSDISRIKDEIASLQREQYDSLQQVKNHLKDVKSRTSALEQTSFKQNADTSLEKEKFVEEIQQLRGQLEETQHRLSEIQGAKETSVPEKAAMESDVPADKTEHFVSAKKLYDNKEYVQAVASFNAFLERYKDDKQFANQALFMRANAYYEQAKNADKNTAKKDLYKKAVLGFQDVLTRFPASGHVPEALYKVGNSLEGMGFPKDAIVFYEEVLNKHPKSAFVKDAKAKLSKIKLAKKKV